MLHGAPSHAGAHLPSVKHYRDVPREETEILVGSEYGKAVAYRNRTNQEISARALDSVAAAHVGVTSRRDVVLGDDQDVREGGQALGKTPELLFLGDARQQLLANRPNHLNTMIQDKAAELFGLGRSRLPASSQSGGPNTCIDQDPQRLALSFL